MKIKDILESIESLKMRIAVAYRIFHCTPQIKTAIKKWKVEEDLPVVRIQIKESEDNFIYISSYDLVNLYGFQELPALLMLDDLLKAQESDNKGRIKELLGFLVYGKHEIKSKVSQDVFEYIKKNDPEVWNEYQKLCNKVTQSEEELETEYSKIIETDL